MAVVARLVVDGEQAGRNSDPKLLVATKQKQHHHRYHLPFVVGTMHVAVRAVAVVMVVMHKWQWR